MKLLKSVMFAAMLLLMPVYAFSSNLGYMRISLLEGDIQIKTPETEEWGLASINGPLAEGDQIWVPQGGRVELQLNSGTYIRLDQDTALQILSMDKDSSQFYLSQGNAYVYYAAPHGNVIQMDTPDTSTRAFSKSIFRMDMSDHYTEVSVYKGYVETENKMGNARINAGQSLSIGQDINAEIAPMGQPDEWETWNKERNARLFTSSSQTSRYLPPELRAYSYDLESNGRWVQVPEYGYVWTPRLVAKTSWTPYRDGRWLWRGGEYVWVAHETWGWAPYHYGRWSFVTRIGWCWVPPVSGAVYWGPGYVGWVKTADYVAWVPLAPGEIYYGRGYYGKHSVNINNIKYHNIPKTYKNVHINNGVTIVNLNTFNTGSPTIVTVNKSTLQHKLFVKNNISAGAPDIKPTKESYFISRRRIPQEKLPPQPVANLQVKDLKNLRPLIKEAAKSVINPGAKPQTLHINTVTMPRVKGKTLTQPVQPADKPKTVTPEAMPLPRTDRQSLKPADKNRPVVHEGITIPRTEKQQPKPAEKDKTVSPEVKPMPRTDRQSLKPADKNRPVVHEGITIPRTEKQQPKPAEKDKTVSPEVKPMPRTDRQSLKPADKGNTTMPKTERHQPKPAEKNKTVSPEDTTDTTEKVLQPAEDSQKNKKRQGTAHDR